jgi:hypothetical protein
MDLTEQVKLLLGIADDSKDGIIGYLVSFISGLALRYCKLSESTDELDFVLAGMIVERYRVNDYGKDSIPKQVQTVKEDDTQITYYMRNAPQAYILSNELTDGEKAMLVPFRKLWS